MNAGDNIQAGGGDGSCRPSAFHFFGSGMGGIPRGAVFAESSFAAEVEAITAEVKQLFDTADHPEATMERIEAVCVKLPTLQKKQLTDIAKLIGLAFSSRATIPDLVKEIGARLRRRKESVIRDEIATPAAHGAGAPVGGSVGVGGG